MRRRSSGSWAFLAVASAVVTAVGVACSNGTNQPQNPATIRIENQRLQGECGLGVPPAEGCPVNRVWFKSCGAANWGQDRLGQVERINSGNSREFAVAAGCWDLRVEIFDAPRGTEGVGLDTLENLGNDIPPGGLLVWAVGGDEEPQDPM